jgi:hypothetical protein
MSEANETYLTLAARRLIYTCHSPFLIGAEPRETQSAETAASTLFRRVNAGRTPRYKFSLLGSYCQRTGHYHSLLRFGRPVAESEEDTYCERSGPADACSAMDQNSPA